MLTCPPSRGHGDRSRDRRFPAELSEVRAHRGFTFGYMTPTLVTPAHLRDALRSPSTDVGHSAVPTLPIHGTPNHVATSEPFRQAPLGTISAWERVPALVVPAAVRYPPK